MIKAVTRLSDGANRLTEWALVPIVGFFALLLMVSVFSRYVFQLPIVPTIEMTRIAFVWACFLGVAAGLKRGVHVRVVAFVSLLPPALARLVPPFVHLCFLVFSLLMVWHGWTLTARTFVTTFPTLGISQGWLYLALPVTGALMSLHATAALLAGAPAGIEPSLEGEPA
jgi:TRAP-type transport system small permease protein